MSTLNIHKVRSALNMAGHPRTPDNLALTASRKAYEMVDQAGLSFDDLTIARTSTTARLLKQQQEEIERLRADKEQRLLKEQRDAATIESLTAEVARLNAKIEQMEAEGREQGGAASPDIGADALRAALTKFVEIDPDMPVKRALATVEVYSGEGLSVKEIANRVPGFTDASVRYALRSLGSGWPGKRTGLGLVTERPKMKSERAGQWVMTTVGRRTISDVLKAMRAAKPPSHRVQLLLAA